MCLLCKCNAFTKHIELLLNLCSSFPRVFYVFSNTCFNLTGWCECQGITLIIVRLVPSRYLSVFWDESLNNRGISLE